VPKLERNLLLSCRNVPGLDVILDEGLNCYDVLRHDRLVILEGSVSRVENRLQK
jgi:large subunit ribosomal protein L4